jgi:formate dehydrogenase major subunit
MSKLSRRDFLKVGAAGTAGLAAASTLGFDLAQAKSIKQNIRIAESKTVVSICPYCAVGCSTLVYVKNNKILQIEGNPDSPINQGTLCPKGSSNLQLALSEHRVQQPLYRAPNSTEWKKVDWDFVMDKIARNVKEARDASFVATDGQGNVVNRTEGIGFAGGATISNEEGYLTAKVLRSLGIVYVEQQART